jgi:LysM repeat protein
MTNNKTQKEVEALCVKAGFSTSNAKVAAAISMVEAPYSEGGKSYSDFDLIGDQALANATWGYSYGGFQIRSLNSQRGTGGIRDAERLPDPAFNVNSAFQVWKSQGFAAWSTYNTGQYKALMQDVFPPPQGVYIVVPGDSLSRIASRLKVGAWQDLARVNALRSPYRIFIGQALLLPWFEYTVKSGDTLGKIVTTYGQGVTVSQVQEFNGIVDANKISPGQVIRIPRSTL